MKESGKERLKYVVYESTRAPLRVNLYKGRCPIKNHSRPFLWKGQTSEARRVILQLSFSLDYFFCCLGTHCVILNLLALLGPGRTALLFYRSFKL